jgi:hypothetical protein
MTLFKNKYLFMLAKGVQTGAMAFLLGSACWGTMKLDQSNRARCINHCPANSAPGCLRQPAMSARALGISDPILLSLAFKETGIKLSPGASANRGLPPTASL